MKTLLVLLAVLTSTLCADAAVTWTCTKDFQSVEKDRYEVVGKCAASGTYTTGGDAIGSAATASAAAAAVCHSSAQTLTDLEVTTSSDGALAVNPRFAFDHTNFKVQAFCSVPCAGLVTLTSGSASITTGCVAAVATTTANVACTDTTAAAAVQCTPTSGTLTVAGTGSDVINYIVLPLSGTPGECISATSMTNQKFRFRAVCK